MTKYEYTSVVLHLEKKNATLSREDVLRGVAADGTKALGALGEAGWELVSVLPYSSGSMGLSSYAGTDAALGFLKRPKD